MNKGNLKEDPRGLLFEAYRIDGITSPECKTIFLDWILGLASDLNVYKAIQAALNEYQASNPGHPMTQVLIDGLEDDKKVKYRRGGRLGRLNSQAK
tara:strand:- start:750 stop:1037 length:288 start_codon:yes stop_codon:yes gene_type:complete